MSERRYYREENSSGGWREWVLTVAVFAILAVAFYLRPVLLDNPHLAVVQVWFEDTWRRVESWLPDAPTATYEVRGVIAKQNMEEKAVMRPAELRYFSAAYGHFIFSNNPEQLQAADLADKNQGNVLLYQARVSGPTQILAEHVNKVSIDGATQQIYFGVQFYNPGDVAITFTVERQGRSIADWSGSSLWKQFLQYRPQTVTLEPKAMQWLFVDQMIPYDQVFDAALALDIPLTQEVEVNLAAFTKLKNLDGNAIPRPMVVRQESDGQQSSRVYSGSGAYPLLSCTLEWALDDTVTSGSALPLEYNGRRHEYWITHDSKNAAALREDIIPLNVTFPSGTKIIDAWSDDESGQPYNLANWGVQYVQTIGIENRGQTERVVRYLVQPSAAETPKQTLLGWVEGETLQILQHSTEEGKQVTTPQQATLWEVRLKPGEHVEKSVFLILATGSYGGVRHSLCVVE